MSKLNLATVTLIAATTRDHDETAAALRHTLSICDFAKTVIFTDQRGPLADTPGAEVLPLGKWRNHEDSSVWGMFYSPRWDDHYEGTHVLSIHYDGFPVNPDAWDDQWLDYDFIGAPWGDGEVGNSGFCLVSRRLLRALTTLGINPTYEDCHPHDVRLSRRSHFDKRTYRDELEALGMRWAPFEVARRFSVDCPSTGDTPHDPSIVYDGQFGFHGRPLLRQFREGALGLG